MLVYSKLVGISGLVIGLDMELNLPKWGSETCKTNSKSKNKQVHSFRLAEGLTTHRCYF